jgi:hypothetical protein
MRILVFILCFILASKLYATNGFIQSASCNSNTGAVNCALPFNVTAGNTLIVGCLGGTSLLTSTDTKGQTYTAVGAQIAPVSRAENVFYTLNAAAGATTITCTNTSNNGIQAAVHEYASTVTAGGFDVTSSSVPVASSLVTATSGNAVTTHANELMFDFCDLASAPSAENGTLRQNFANNFFQASQDTIVASPSSYASTFTQSAGTFGCIEAAFNPVASAVTPAISCKSPFCGVLGQ